MTDKTSQLSTPPLAGPAGSRRRQPAGPHGFTLIEVMIVVAVLSIMVSIAVPTLAPMTKPIRLREAAEQVAGFMEEARRLAYNSGRCARVRRVSATQLVIEPRTTADCVTDDSSNWGSVLTTLNAPYTQITYTLSVATGTAGSVVFRPGNRLRGNGDVSSSDDAARVVVNYSTYAAAQYAVGVTGLGRICVERVGNPAIALAAASVCP